MDYNNLNQAEGNAIAAYNSARMYFATVATSIQSISLSKSVLPNIPPHSDINDIYGQFLTAEQKSFVDYALVPVRLSGYAGTGKTYAMILKMLWHAYQRIDSRPPKQFRFLFLTHNNTARDLVLAYIERLDHRKIQAEQANGRVLIIDTLLNLAYSYLSAELSNTELVSIDAHEGKKLQLEFISDIVDEYRRGAWLTRPAKASEQMRQWINAAKGTPIHNALCWDIMNEFACVLDAENVRDSPERRKRYINSLRMRSLMQLQVGTDREVLLDLYDEFRKALYTLGVISIDQLMLDFMGYLDSFRWVIKRESEGFDAIFVDEFHLFNSVERSTFLSLLKDRSAVPALLMAYDTRQSPRETYFGLDTEVTLSDATPEKFSVRKTRQFDLTGY